MFRAIRTDYHAGRLFIPHQILKTSNLILSGGSFTRIEFHCRPTAVMHASRPSLPAFDLADRCLTKGRTNQPYGWSSGN